MKSLKCDLCETEIKGEDFDFWFKAAYAHWASDHADAMKAMEGRPKEEGEKWMAEAKKGLMMRKYSFSPKLIQHVYM